MPKEIYSHAQLVEMLHKERKTHGETPRTKTLERRISTAAQKFNPRYKQQLGRKPCKSN